MRSGKITSETNVFLPNTTFAADCPAFVCLSPHCGHLILVCRVDKCIDFFLCLRLRYEEHVQNKVTSYPILVRGQHRIRLLHCLVTETF